MKIILEELNSNNLKNKTDDVVNRLKKEIEALNNLNNNIEQTELGNKRLKILTNDFQQLVQIARNKMTGNVSTDIRIIANRIDKIWRETIYPLINEYDKCVDKYNLKNGTKLQHICKRTGDKILPSIKTFKHFNY